MGFIEKATEAAGTAFGGIPGAVVGGVLGNEFARQGAGIGTRQSLGYEAEMWKRAQDRGLTPQEYYGSPAPGASPNAGGGQVIGNQAAQLSSQSMQLAQQASENQKNRDNALEIARIQSGDKRYGHDIQAEIAANILSLDREKWQQMQKQVAMDLKISEQKLKQEINNVVTSAPEFVMRKISLQMGPDNEWVQAYKAHHGIDPINNPEDFKKMSHQERADFLMGFIAYKSHFMKEASGLADLLFGSLEPDANPSAPQNYVEKLGNQSGEKKKIYDGGWFPFKVYKHE